ncbi:MAG TPA: ABC transporter substrate-binding protein [Gemmataceae bacterium]|nr:ABC transporter substrate-binding protein [Gemmataceae bacterium]
MAHRFAVPATGLALILGLLAGCQQDATPPPPTTGWVPGTLRFGAHADFKSLDPALANDTDSIPFVRTMCQSLLDYDDGVNLVPLLAESMPDVSADGMTYTFHLRKGVRFSNGRELTSEDFVYSWTRVLDPATVSPGQSYVKDLIAGAKEYSDWRSVEDKQKAHQDLTAEDQQVPRADAVSGLSAPDARRFQVKLTHADQTFPYVIAMTYFAPVPREEIEKYPQEERKDQFTAHPVGTGPFVLKEWRRSLRLRLERDPHYWDAEHAPALQALEVRFGLDDLTKQMMFERGELDLMNRIPSAAYVRLKHDPRWQPCFEKLVFNGAFYLWINCEMEPFAGEKGRLVRRALRYAIDKERIAQVSNDRYVPAKGVVPPQMPGYKSQVLGCPYDPKAAKRLLAEAGYADGVPDSLALWVSNEESSGERIAEVIQQDLKAVGFRKVEVNAVNFDVYQAMTGKHKTAPLCYGGWYQDYPDPSDFLYQLFSSNSITDSDCNNLSFYHSDKADELMDQAGKEHDPAKRMEQYAEAEKRIVEEDAAVVPVVDVQEIWLRQTWVTGFHIHPVWLVKYDKLSITPP